MLHVGADRGRGPVFAYIMEGRTIGQRATLVERMTTALEALLPDVEIISVNVAEDQRSTYRNKAWSRAQAAPPSKPG